MPKFARAPSPGHNIPSALLSPNWIADEKITRRLAWKRQKCTRFPRRQTHKYLLLLHRLTSLRKNSSNSDTNLAAPLGGGSVGLGGPRGSSSGEHLQALSGAAASEKGTIHTKRHAANAQEEQQREKWESITSCILLIIQSTPYSSLCMNDWCIDDDIWHSSNYLILCTVQTRHTITWALQLELVQSLALVKGVAHIVRIWHLFLTTGERKLKVAVVVVVVVVVVILAVVVLIRR